MYLTNSERAIVIFLTASLLLGAGISCYRKVTDKVKIAIVPANTVSDDNLDALVKSAKCLNINTADISALKKLPGIGPSLAKEIVEYRNRHGLFQDAQDLNNVRGIGRKKLEAIREYITVE